VEILRGPSKRNIGAMNNRTAFLQSLKPLKEILLSDAEILESQIDRAFRANPWFIPAFTKRSFDAIAEEFLDEQKCSQWIASYPSATGGPKRIAVIMAGNLPLVGFHDLFCILASGHSALIKLSDRDTTLMPWITEQWISIYPELASRISYTDRFEGYDAVIATGSNNSGRYFEYYFRAYPHILRQNRNGVAVLTGQETMDDLKRLAGDIFMYFGFGCRNVSKIYIPQGYDFSMWNETTAAWKYLEDHHKYKNNLEYNYAIFIINSIPHLNLGHLILKEDDAIASRIGCLHYSYYTEREPLLNILDTKREEIQCVISQEPIESWEHVHFGDSQRPRLDQYADGIDTMQFLTSL